MWKIVLAGNQKSENTQVKVLLSQFMYTQGIPLTFSHVTISVMQAFVEG